MNIIYCLRTDNWNGYLEAIYMFLPYCFSLNRQNYSRNLSYYYADMIDLKMRNPTAYKYLENGRFCGSLSGNNFSNIPMDQVIEMTINRFSKTVGGLSGKTENIAASNKWTRLNHYMGALKEHMDETIGKRKKQGNVELGKRRIEKDEEAVRLVKDGLLCSAPNMYIPHQSVYNISTGVSATKELINNAKTLKMRGEYCRNSFFDRIASFNDDREDKMPLLTLPLRVIQERKLIPALKMKDYLLLKFCQDMISQH